ncbi:MAG: carboxypeptidase M32 [Candidatus Kapabacteria bacterium]|nr:carboxypeptidase M32 [Candidatus Kapabacteria bacterium]
MSTQQLIDSARSVMSTVKDLNAASALLGWDQETYMPEGSAEARAEQIATIDTLAHQHITSNVSRTLADDIRTSVSDGGTTSDRLLRLFAREVERASKLPESLVRETSRATALAQESWKKARIASDFSIFAGDLKKLVELKTQAAHLYGYTDNVYDALLDLYEPGITVAQLKPVFNNLQKGTTDLLEYIKPVRERANDAILYKKYDSNKQLQYAQYVARAIGFNFTTGRVDVSTHPFCTSFAPTDVRLTTRIFEDDLRSCLFGLIHEAGHGMYEQGFAPELTRTFGADGASMGIHESQSLFWENVIARSEEFWQWGLPLLKDYFPEQLSGVSAFEFYKAINTIEPSLIRIEADEVTYNIHIIIRFEIEEQLINGSLNVEDIPAVWNAKMKEYLGITPPNDAKGCLQDIHWSFGGFGYFPSYTLGKLYAAMLRKQLLSDIPGISDEIRRGHFKPILAWLREKIHYHGKTMTPNELIVSITGRQLTEADFLDYARQKAERVYEMS